MRKNKNKKESEVKREYYETKKYRIFMDIIAIMATVLSLIGIRISLLVRGDTAELAKFSDKPVYYDIKLFVTDETRDSLANNEKYLSLNLKLVIDDFKIKRKNFIDVNYNAVFTRIKYFMVYDYDLKNSDYKYMSYSLDDKTQAQITYDDLYSAPTRMNYSLTPNKEYCYLLIYTETTSSRNLDLIFFKYYDKNDSVAFDTITEDGQERIDIDRIDSDASICEDYFVDLWSDSDSKKAEDLEFLFDVYADLKSKKM